MNLPPGPKSFWELIKMIIQRQKNPIKLYEKIFKKYGDVVFFKLGSFRFLMINNAVATQQVLQTDAQHYTKSSFYERFKVIFGNGLLVSDGALWKKQRRLIAGSFSANQIERLHPIMVRETSAILSKWKIDEKIDLAKEMNRMTLEIISVGLLGKRQESDSEILREALQEILTYLQSSRHLWLHLLIAPFPIKNKYQFTNRLENMLPFRSTKKFLRSIQKVNQLVLALIEERRNKNLKENFLDILINLSGSDEESKMSDQQMRDEVLNFLLAGHESTANALTWTWHELLKNPEVYHKMKQEVNRVIKGETPLYEEVAQLTYTRAVFEETIRLFPPFWRISRTNKVATKIKHYDIPEGTNIFISIYSIQRSKKYWKNPENFLPERFLPESDDIEKFSFIPFGAGPRICVGMNFALVEAITILSTVIKRYDIEKAFDHNPTFRMGLNLTPKEGCMVRVKDSSKGEISILEN
jgi:cytochrome P450